MSEAISVKVAGSFRHKRLKTQTKTNLLYAIQQSIPPPFNSEQFIKS